MEKFRKESPIPFVLAVGLGIQVRTGTNKPKAVDFVKHAKQFVLVADRPSTVIQLLWSYTINIRYSELALQQLR